MPIVDEVMSIAAAAPDRPAVVTADRTLTYGELASCAAELELGSVGKGPDGQSLIALSLADPVEFAIAFLAAVSRGRCAAILDPAWPSKRHDQALERLGADVVVASLKDVEQRPNTLELEDGPETNVFYLGFTSGSSSRPKVFLRDRGSWRRSLERSTDVFGFRPGKRVLACGSLASSISLYVLAECLHTGATFHWLDVEDAAGASSVINSARIEHLASTPTLLAVMARRAPGAWDSVETVVCGGASLLPEQRRRIREVAPGSRLFEYYGASELSVITVKEATRGASMSDQSAGMAFPGVEIAIRCSEDGPGTVWVKTDTACRGYLDNEDRWASDDGWYTVGDQGSKSTDGRLHLRGRSSGMILSSGLNVYPEEVEAALSAVGYPGSCVVGRPHPVQGAQLVAVLPAHTVQGQCRHEVMRRLRLELTSGAVPNVYMVADSLPLLGAGKLDRRAVAAAVAGDGGDYEFLQ